MGTVSLSEIKPDMVLADDLRHQNGRFLLNRGTKLESKHIRMLKMWGVIEADVEGVNQKNVEEDIISALDPAIVEAAEENAHQYFAHTDLEHPVINDLFCRRRADIAEKIHKNETVERLSTKNATHNIEVADSIPENTLSPVNPVELLKNDINLPTLPTVFIQINDSINKPTRSAKDIAEVISTDINLSAKLLKIVNSAFYGFPSAVDTLTRAVAILGTRQLSTLSMGINILTAFKDIPDGLIDMQSFWKHSIACGTLSRIIASYKGIQNTERLFLSGLMHDIGRLVLFNYSPDNAGYVLKKARRENRLLYEQEHETMCFDHAMLGALLLRKWKLPKSLENAVKYHHKPINSKDPIEPAIVHLADIIAVALGIGSSGERYVPPLDPEAWDCIGLSPNILPLTIKQLDNQLEEILMLLQ
jgi:putative nucleotidyltransferase with HDIG domain